jgi:uncharacterized membrane protein YdjX (TVP38/TMEM64 family)
MTRDRWLRLLLLALAVAAVIVFYLAGLHEQLRWESVRSRIEHWQRLADEHLLVSLTVFFLLYVTATALSLPVALILSLVGGALFGRWVGVGVVSVASTCGASLAFLGSRYLFRTSVRKRFGDRLAALDRGIERDGAWYLLTLRMAPYVPFFLINLGLGLTPMRLATFALVSWVGMLPATFVLVNAGTELAALETPSDALSPTFVGSLALIGLLPLGLRLLLRRLSIPGQAAPPSPPG